MKEPKIFAFYSNLKNQGKQTLSLALAQYLAELNYKILYVEMDVNNPSVSESLNITDKDRNFVQLSQKFVSNYGITGLDQFVINKKKLVEKDAQNKAVKFSDNVDFVILPKDFTPEKFPVVFESDMADAEQKADNFIEQLVGSLKTSNYDYIVCNLPNNYEHLLGFKLMEKVDRIVSVIKPSAYNIKAYKDYTKDLEKLVDSFNAKHITLINMASQNVEIDSYLGYFKVNNNNSHVLNFDHERQLEEFAMNIGSDYITQQMERIATLLGIEITPTKAKKFQLFGRGVG